MKNLKRFIKTADPYDVLQGYRYRAAWDLVDEENRKKEKENLT